MSRKRKTTAKELLGKHVLVGITKIDSAQNIVSQDQFHGVVTAIDSVIHIRLSTGADYTLPPDPASFFPATPGEYRLRATGEAVVDPNFTASWTVQAPSP